MKYIYIGLALLSSIITTTFASGITHISCSGTLSFENGTMSGNSTETLTLKNDGSWKFNNFDAGFNISENSRYLILDTYGFRWWPESQAVYAKYDTVESTLEFEYKYSAGFNGGSQHTEGIFTGCSVR